MKSKINNLHYKILKNIIDKNDVNSLRNYLTINNIDVNSNFNPNEHNRDTLFFYSVRKSKLEIAKYLMTIDSIKVDIPNSNHTTPISHTIIFQKEDFFDLIMSNISPGLKYVGEIDESSNSNEKMYPLARASQAKSFKMVKAIVEHPDNDFLLCGNQPYFYAISNKQTEIALYLLNSPNFDPYITAGGRNAYKFACEVGNRKVIKALLDLPKFNLSIDLEDKFKLEDTDKKKFEPLWWEPFRFMSNLEFSKKISDLVLNHPKIDVNQKDRLGKSLIEHHLEVNNQQITFDVLVNCKKIDIYSFNEKDQNILESFLSYHKSSNFLEHIYTRRLKSLVDRIIEEKPEILNEQCERLVSLEAPLQHKNYVLSRFRNEILQKSLIKKVSPNRKAAICKI